MSSSSRVLPALALLPLLAACGATESEPIGCPDLWAPVCGADGQTWPNACEATAAGVAIVSEGECESDSGDAGADAPSDTAVLDADDDTAVLDTDDDTAAPDAQDDTADTTSDSGAPDVTDDAAPDADADDDTTDATPDAGDDVADPDAPDADDDTPDAGSGCDLTASANPCEASEFCRAEPMGCNLSAAEGTCATRPEMCTEMYSPVCGCDGITYGNACMAEAAGQNHTDGACPSLDDCRSGDDCDRTEYCELPEGVCRAPGRCAPTPDMCTRVWDPVCGCDGNTYGNPCLAAQAGMSIASRGECGGGGGCTSNLDCMRGDYCALGAGICEGNGSCEARPDACPLVYIPVCGCDGTTYGNACEAASAGVNIAAEGECL